ncbi:MAG: hypothetical protein GQ564_17385 [Bacteroidales bacterium]|nr:hypothetical protein [Bacteroidales bacterium]
MKKFVKFSKCLIVLLTVILFTQCEEEESTPSFNNAIKMNGNDFSVVTASITGVSMGVLGHSSISFINGSETQGKSLTINVESFTQATIEGDYAFPEVSGKKILDDWLTVYVDYDGTNINTSELETGEVSVTHNSGNNYTVSMNIEMVDGVTFTGSYTGDFIVMFNTN